MTTKHAAFAVLAAAAASTFVSADLPVHAAVYMAAVDLLLRLLTPAMLLPKLNRVSNVLTLLVVSLKIVSVNCRVRL
jgi:hypothetical protein